MNIYRWLLPCSRRIMLLPTENDVKEDGGAPKEEAQCPLTSPALWLRCRVRCCRWTSALVGLLLCRGSRGSMNVVVRELWSTKKACTAHTRELITNIFLFIVSEVNTYWESRLHLIRWGCGKSVTVAYISLLHKENNTFPSHQRDELFSALLCSCL